MKFLLVASLLVTFTLATITDFDLDAPDRHDPPEPEELDVLPRDTNPPPDCRLYPVRPGYFQCRRSLLRCMEKDSNICHDHCHRSCRRVCYVDYNRCVVRARLVSSYDLEQACVTREDECHVRCMETCEKHCQPCRDMFHTCRRCVTNYEESLRLEEVPDIHDDDDE